MALEYDPELERQAWLEEGLEQGIKKGRMEERFEMVKNLLLAKTPMKYIVTATGWTEEQILKIAEKGLCDSQ
ncbi:MAG: hypothetical protein IKT98_07595 [Selenomonadaceae bacterium]|nr:hypothetical protein [Selenomonadaceae bacterium]